MKKFLVTVWKTETYSTQVEVDAGNEDDAMVEAEEQASESPDVVWDFSEGTIEADRVEEIEDET